MKILSILVALVLILGIGLTPKAQAATAAEYAILVVSTVAAAAASTAINSMSNGGSGTMLP